MNELWERKPHDYPRWREFRIEDLFLCHLCNNWFPWVCYTKGLHMALPGYPNLDDTYKYMNDEEDRGGRRWACNRCIENVMYESELVTIRISAECGPF